MQNIYNFNLKGDCLGFNSKLTKHVNNNDAGRVIDYILQAYTDFPANKMKQHPCYDKILDVCHNFLNEKRWIVRRVKINGNYQICCEHKDLKLYSNYDYYDTEGHLRDYNLRLNIGRKPLEEKEYDNLMNIAEELLYAFSIYPPDKFEHHPLKNILNNSIKILKEAGWKVEFFKDKNNAVQFKIIAYHGFKEWISDYNYDNKED